MPHKQKEFHGAGKSGKAKLKAKKEALARKKAIADAKEAAEKEAEKIRANITPLAEGHGEYEIGCEPPREYNFNANKRNKKHLFNDLRKKIERAEREEEERKKREQEEQWRQEHGQDSSSDEEEVIIEEYIIYICECCNKKFATQNQFVNHSNSKKHRDNAAIFEEAGMMVTGVELRGENDQDEYINCDDDEGGEWEVEEGIQEEEELSSEEEEELEEELEFELEQQRKPNLFAVFNEFDDSSSESSEEEKEEEDRKLPPSPPVQLVQNDASNDNGEDSEEDVDLEEIIYQNQLLQSKIDSEKTSLGVELPPVPVPFDRQYDPDDYDVNENRLEAVRYRLQKRLAEKGIEPTRIESYASDQIAMGKTLLQQVMEANINTLQAKLDAYNKHKQECALLGREFAFAKGNSKALAGQYTRKQDAADDSRKRANVHHAGSHYHMAASRSMQFGRAKGLMARHSSQGARLQASRMAAKETARMQSGGGGMKVGKTSKKSNQKRRGEAGGSKKSGGEKGGSEI